MATTHGNTIPYLGCTTCGQPFHPRHDHPHDYSGELIGFVTGVPCTICHRPHRMSAVTVAWFPRREGV